MNTWLSHTSDRDDDAPAPTDHRRVAIGHRLSESFERWTKIYEKHLAEFASETGGVPTREHEKRASELADREMFK